MSKEIKRPTNQVNRSANGNFYVHWHGGTVFDNDNTVRKFPTEAEAWTYLAACDKAGKIID